MSTSFSSFLRQYRKEQGLSQQQLAQQLHVDRSTITKWESGARVPDVNVLPILSEYLGLDLGELFRERESEPLRVILVDDETILLEGTVPVLSRALPGAIVKGFTSPRAALDYCAANPVALAFLDIELGRKSGMDLCRELLEFSPQTNVIYLTAYKEYALPAWDSGACGFLLKPLTETAVRSQLTRLRFPLRIRGGGGTAPPRHP